LGTTKLNGTELIIEKIKDIVHDLCCKNLFGDYRIPWIDEADEIPRITQIRLLTVLDDLKPGVVIVCTSNCKLADFENRFQTRFQALLPDALFSRSFTQLSHRAMFNLLRRIKLEDCWLVVI
jgi:hypothetical protein